MLGMLVEHPDGNAPRASGGRSRRAQRPDRGQSAREGDPPGAEVETIRLQALGTPQVLAQIRSQNPELADAVADPQRFQEVWQRMMRHQRDNEATKQRELALLNADPFNEETQRKIEEIIREERVMENVQNAIQYMPEGPIAPPSPSVSPPQTFMSLTRPLSQSSAA